METKYSDDPFLDHQEFHVSVMPTEKGHLTFTCSYSTIETLEKGVKFVQS